MSPPNAVPRPSSTFISLKPRRILPVWTLKSKNLSRRQEDSWLLTASLNHSMKTVLKTPQRHNASNWQEVFQVLTERELLENAAKFRVRVLASHFAFARHEIEINWRLGFSDIFDRSDPLLRAYINITRALVLRTLTLWDQQLLWCSNFNQLMMLKKNGQWCDILRP